MRIIKNLGFVGLLLAGMGTQLDAQQSVQKGWQIGAAMPVAMEGLKQWTNQSFMGLCLDGSYLMPIAGGGAYFRFGLGVNYLPGREGNGHESYLGPGETLLRTITLYDIQANVDVMFPIGSSPLSLFTGLSLNTWYRKVSGQYQYDPSLESNASGMVKNAFGKYGLRLGAEYAVSRNLSVALTFQMTELGTDLEFLGEEHKYDENGNMHWWVADGYGEHAVNPTWIQVGVRYRF
jgi:hypothetical protein